MPLPSVLTKLNSTTKKHVPFHDDTVACFHPGILLQFTLPLHYLYSDTTFCARTARSRAFSRSLEVFSSTLIQKLSRHSRPSHTVLTHPSTALNTPLNTVHPGTVYPVHCHTPAAASALPCPPQSYIPPPNLPASNDAHRSRWSSRGSHTV